MTVGASLARDKMPKPRSIAHHVLSMVREQGSLLQIVCLLALVQTSYADYQTGLNAFSNGQSPNVSLQIAYFIIIRLSLCLLKVSIARRRSRSARRLDRLIRAEAQGELQ